MKVSRVLIAVAAASIAIGLSACAISAPAGTPVVVNTEDIQGSIVEVPVNATLVLNTGALAVDSYTAEVADPAIAEFTQGKDDGAASTNPGLKPLKAGTTGVTLTNEDGGIQDVEFTLTVKPLPGGADLGGTGR